jgi:hypothetical protein
MHWTPQNHKDSENKQQILHCSLTFSTATAYTKPLDVRKKKVESMRELAGAALSGWPLLAVNVQGDGREEATARHGQKCSICTSCLQLLLPARQEGIRCGFVAHRMLKSYLNKLSRVSFLSSHELCARQEGWHIGVCNSAGAAC